MVAVRFPFPVAVRTTDEVSTGKSDTEFNFNCNTAPPLKRPERFGIHHGARSRRAFGKYCFTTNSHRLSQGRGKSLTGLADLRNQGFPKIDRQHRATGTTTGLDSATFFAEPDALPPLAGTTAARCPAAAAAAD